MKKIRIGNDIVIKWRITINGEEVNLEGLDLSLYISTTYQPRREIAFTVAGNEITATYRGNDQRVTGVYRLTLYRNEGENAQSILDACDAFELVSCSCLTVDAAFGGAEVELPIADLGVGIPGLSAYEIACIEGFKGTQAEWIASLSAASEAAAAECREVIAEFSQAEDSRVTAEAQRVANENNRIAGEGSRVEAENDRAAAEQLRATAESKRDTAELARIANESNRVSAEVGRSSAEELRKSNEQSRISEETTRSNNEAARIAAETKRANAELTRKNNEDARQEAERGRVTAETARQSAEADRATNERSRTTAEQQRVTNETARSNAESSRATAETARQEAETARQEAEQGRVTAEQQRADAEAARAEEFATFEGKIAAKEDVANKVTSIGADANNTTFPTTRAVLNSIAEVKNIEVTPEMLSESTKQYINASGGGTITNLADDEDLTSVGNVLKLADKGYSPTSYSGMGRVYLRKNMVGGKNILTQEMMTKENTIYIIQYDYDLNGATINVPANCTLDFQGGSLGNGTVELNYAKLIGNIKMFANFTHIKNPKVCLSWFINSSTPSVISDTIDRVMSECKGKIIEIDKSITIARTIVVPCNTSIKGITMQLGTFVYPSKEFVGQYVFDFEGDNIDGGWVFRSDVSNLWINLSLYEGDGDLSAIFHINRAYSLNISNIRIDNMKVPLSGFLLSNITVIRLENCAISGIDNTSGKYGIDCIDNIRNLDAISIDVENFPRGIVVRGESNINLVNLYAERCGTAVFSNSLAKKGNITMSGGVILLPSSSANGCSFTIIKDNGTINIIGVKFRADNGGAGVYLDGREDYMGNVNIVGVEDKYISIYRGGNLTKLNAPNIRGAKNIYALSGRVALQNLKKKVIGRISYSAEGVKGGGLIRIWAATNIAEDSVYHYVKKTFQFNTYASTIYLKEIEEPIIGHANSYNFNAYINIECDKYYRSSDRVNGIKVSLETKFTGGLVNDTSSMLVSYNVEVVSLFNDNVIYLEEDNSDATSIESFTPELYNKKGASSSRPSNVREGFFYFDTTLNKPIWWKGNAWVDATGQEV